MNLKPQKPKTIRHSMPMKDFQAMAMQAPRIPGMKLATRRHNPKLNAMNFYYK